MNGNPLAELEGELLDATGAQRVSLLCDVAAQVVARDPRRALALADEVLELSAAGLGTPDAVRARAARAEARVLLGDIEEGLADAQRAVALATASGSVRAEAVALSALGHALGRLDRYREAGESIQKSLELFKRRGTDAEIALARLRLGVIVHQRGQFRRAEELYLASLEVLRNAGSEERAASALANLGLLRGQIGRYVDALDATAESLAIAERLDQPLEVARRWHNLGTFYWELGKYSAALAALRRSIEAYGAHREAWRPLSVLAHVYATIGWDEEARRIAQKTLEQTRENHERLGEGAALHALGEFYRATEEWGPAEESYAASREIFEELGVERGTGESLYGLACVHEARGEWSRALEHLRAGEVAQRRAGDVVALVRSLIGTGRVRDAMGDVDAAGDALREARELAETFDSRILAPELYRALAEHYRSRGSFGQALDCFARFHEEITARLENEVEARVLAKQDVEASSSRALPPDDLIAIAELREVYKREHELDEAARTWRERYADQVALLERVTHDLRNPLVGITGNVSLGLHDADRPEIVDKFRAIGNAADRMLCLLRELLQPAHLQSGGTVLPMRPEVDLESVVRDVTASSEAAATVKGTRLEWSTAGRVSRVHADERWTREVVENLVSNAVKFAPCGGQVTVRVDGPSVIVEDDGPGLSDEDRARMFVRFSRLSALPTNGEPSTGLGLYIVKRLMNAMGGEIVCEDVPSGARFRATWTPLA